MDGETLFLIELVLLHGAVLLFAFYELWSLRRDRKKREKDADKKRD